MLDEELKKQYLTKELKKLWCILDNAYGHNDKNIGDPELDTAIDDVRTMIADKISDTDKNDGYDVFVATEIDNLDYVEWSNGNWIIK